MSDHVPCPRCGYDLHGIVDSWRESCPLDGLCTECGLELRWPEVIQPDKFEPQWCVEFTPRRRSLPTACVNTFFRSLWPWAFWSRLLMSQPIRGRRLAVYACFLLLPLALLYVGVQATVALQVRSQLTQELAVQRQQVAATVAQYQRMVKDQERMLARSSTDLAPAPDISRRLLQLKQAQVWVQGLAQNRTTIDHSPLEAIAEAVFVPLRTSSWGALVDTNGVVTAPYVAPADLWGRLTLPNGAALESAVVPVARMIGAVVALVMFPISFVLLPVSRKRAKVRWAHIWRVFVYSLVIPVALLWTILVPLIMATVIRRPEPLVWIAHQTASLGAWAGLALWWAVAIKRYLRIPHAAAIALLMTFMLSLLLSDLLLKVIVFFKL